METLALSVIWANPLLTGTWLLWFGVGTVIGGIMLLCDERRFHRTKPKRRDVRACVDDLVARHGRDALRVNGDAAAAARSGEAFDRYRFLKALQGELSADRDVAALDVSRSVPVASGTIRRS